MYVTITVVHNRNSSSIGKQGEKTQKRTSIDNDNDEKNGDNKKKTNTRIFLARFLSFIEIRITTVNQPHLTNV
jgi:hypothetical protein